MMSLGLARDRDVESLQNWQAGTGSMAREETAYLSHHEELISVVPAGDNAVLQLETWVEDKLIRYFKRSKDVCEERCM